MAEYKYEDLGSLKAETLASAAKRLSNAFGLVFDDINIIESRFCCWKSFSEDQEYADCVWAKFEYSGDLYVASYAKSHNDFDKLEMLECWN